MANRFPLIVDSTALQIKELPANDNIDLTDSGIVNAASIGATTINVTGISTFESGIIVNTGAATTALVVEGDARVTGILTAENLTVTSSVIGPGGVGFATEGYVDTAVGLSTNGLLSSTGSAANLTSLTGASNGTYGGSTSSAIITVNSTGRITSISSADISGDAYLSLEVTDGSTSRKSVAALYGRNPRGNGLAYTWSNSGPRTTFYAYGAGGSTDAEQAAQLALGIFSPGTNPGGTYAETSYDEMATNQVIYSEGNFIGPQGNVTTYGRTTSYAPISVLLMPIRNNHPSLSKSITIYGQFANYYSSGYDGGSLWSFAPSSNGTYNISSGTWTRQSFGTGSSYGYTRSATITIPAQTTYCVMQIVSMYYYTVDGSMYRWFDQNRFYNLSTTFSDNYVQVDHRMISTMTYGDLYSAGMTSNSVDNFYRVYTATANLYGNR